jgi:prepilin-type N-terminal cleavage/methylation domain-containing protein
MQLNRNRPSGFTFAEIIIVVGMIGLLAVIALPNLAKATRKQENNKHLPTAHASYRAKAKQTLESRSGQPEPASLTNAIGAEPSITYPLKQPVAVRIANNHK